LRVSDRVRGRRGKPIRCEQREAAHALWPCILRWDCGRVRSLPLARGHRSNRTGLLAGAAVAAAPGAIGAVVPAEPRLSPVPRGAVSCGAVSVSTCLLTARAVVEINIACSNAESALSWCTHGKVMSRTRTRRPAPCSFSIHRSAVYVTHAPVAFDRGPFLSCGSGA
jgi:hypothetical protein